MPDVKMDAGGVCTTQPYLNGRHTIFGQVIDGQEIVDAISLVATQGADRPVQPVIILSIDMTKTS